MASDHRDRDLSDRIRQYWEADAATYDRSPTHAGTEPVEAAAWRAALLRHLPPPAASVLDVGAGTGAMSLLAAELGYRVTALDLSPAMLSAAERKARDRGLPLEAVIGRATEPPSGPFDAVIERHVLWTTPDPVEALRAWRGAAPSGRLVLYEALPGPSGLGKRLRESGAGVARTALGVPSHHHAPYDEEILRSLPLVGMRSPDRLVGFVAAAGWGRIRVERLRDVEWARRLGAPRPLGWLEWVPHVAVVADA